MSRLYPSKNVLWFTYIRTQVSMALDATRGLQALHEAAGGVIIHFDIKPHQLMLDEEGRVKLTDFNLCKFLDIDAEGNACPLLKMSRSKGVGGCTVNLCVCA